MKIYNDVRFHIEKDYSDALRSLVKKHISDKTVAEKIYNAVVKHVCKRYEKIDFNYVNEQAWIYGIAKDTIAAYLT